MATDQKHLEAPKDDSDPSKNSPSEWTYGTPGTASIASETDPFLQKIYARPINKRYVLIRRLGSGGFGAVYLAKDILNEQDVALKLEHHSVEPSILDREADIYKEFQGCTGFPRVYWFGWHDDFGVMAFELLGPSLDDLFEFCERRFSVKTVLMLMDQLLQRLQDLHTRDILHRDIKPQNCLLGTGPNGNTVYMTDFGLAEYVYIYSNSKDDDVPTRPRLIGTARFASRRGHEGRVQSAKDDLESLGYMMVYFLQGSLPWQGIKARDKDKSALVLEQKQTITAEELCKGLPVEFAEFMTTVYSLHHGEMPKYAKLRRKFRRLAKKEGMEYDNVYDWTIRVYLQQAGEDRFKDKAVDGVEGD